MVGAVYVMCVFCVLCGLSSYDCLGRVVVVVGVDCVWVCV